MQILPFVFGGSSGQGYHFIFAKWGFCDCFYGWLMPQNEWTVAVAVYSNIVFSNGMASAIVKAIYAKIMGK